MIEINLIPNLPQIPFRTGVGHYEGIVMHATAVYGDNSIIERSYECAHFKDAFVHAFSDPHSTIEVANPNYIAWGAGQVANYRYLHSELCQVKNDGSDKAKADFKASYDNWINYAAQRLYDRKLGVVCACKEGTGTVWQHYNVTQWLGDSTHVDPMDYLTTWAITWEQVIADIQNKYKELGQMDEILARLKVLEDASEKIAAPTWFVAEFGSADLKGLISEPSKSLEYWQTVATILRAVKFVPAT
jgi:N-acetylmuramoyl-L-alanine amidase CwlA